MNLIPNDFYAVFYAISSILVLRTLINYWKVLRSVHNHPGYRTLLNPNTVLANAIRPIPGVAVGFNHNFVNKFDSFTHFGWNIITELGILSASVSFTVADAATVKLIGSARHLFPKPVEQYTILLFFGRNIVASEGDEWKNYRRVSAPAFSERINKLVWDESMKTVLDLIDGVWKGKEEVTTEHVVEITLPLALFVIGSAGFGRKVSWEDDNTTPPNHAMTFKDALHTTLVEIPIKLLVPEWAKGITSRTRKVRTAYEEVEKYLAEMIEERKASGLKEEHSDLFSSLLFANEEPDTEGGTKLGISELMGNMFIFLVAGHETSAHALAWSFGLLALYQEEQEKLYQNLKDVLPKDGSIPTYEDLPSLKYPMAVIYEALRMFPPVTIIPKRAAQDTVFTTYNLAGEKKAIPVPAGSQIDINVAGLHYNPMYWEDPHSFNPHRFLKEDWPKDAFVPFSLGSRACIGRRFAEVESTAILTMIVSRYKIEVKDEPEFASETFEERRERVLRSTQSVTTTPVRVPLTFRRRT